MGVARPQIQTSTDARRVVRLDKPSCGTCLLAACVLWLVAPPHISASQASEMFRPTIAVTPEGLTCVLGGGLDGEMVDAMTITPLMTHKQEYTLLTLKGISDLVVSIGRPAEESKGTMAAPGRSSRN